MRCSRVNKYLLLLLTFIGCITYYLYKQHFSLTTEVVSVHRRNKANWWQVDEVQCADYMQPYPAQPPYQVMIQMDHRAGRQASLEEEDSYRLDTESCEDYLQRRHFILHSMTEEERNFPIAYSVMVFKDYPQVEMLLRTLYRPEHTICVHVDRKASAHFRLAMERLTECFPENSLFLAANPLSVQWGTMSVLDADLLCMQQLWDLIAIKRWKYFINLTGQEFPLRTNLELVKILKIFNGSNSLEGTVRRFERRHRPAATLSFPFEWVKGSVHITVSAAFVNFTLHNEAAKAVLAALRQSNVRVPDEAYFSTLNHNPQLGTPGAYLLKPETHPNTYPFITRLKNWNVWPFDYPCMSGKIVRQICIWGLRDLPFLIHRPELFVNKFHWTFQNLAQQCLQERYWERTESDLMTMAVRIDLSFYKSLSFVKFHQ